MSPSPNTPQGTPQNQPSNSSATPVPQGHPTAPAPGSSSSSTPRGVPFDLSSLDTNDSQSSGSQWNRAWILLAGALVAFMIFFWAYGLGVRAQRPMPLGPIKSPNAAPATVRVYVEGAVSRPGVYSLSTDARVSDAITLAGGLTSEGDPAALNLAAFVQDGSKISVPRLVPIPPTQFSAPPSQPPIDTASSPNTVTTGAAPPPAPASSSNGDTTKADNAEFLRAHPLDLNTATKEQLQGLPNVGPVMADRIITYRTINGRLKSVADLDNIQGIGEKRLEALRNLVTVR